MLSFFVCNPYILSKRETGDQPKREFSASLATTLFHTFHKPFPVAAAVAFPSTRARTRISCRASCLSSPRASPSTSWPCCHRHCRHRRHCRCCWRWARARTPARRRRSGNYVTAPHQRGQPATEAAAGGHRMCPQWCRQSPFWTISFSELWKFGVQHISSTKMLGKFRMKFYLVGKIRSLKSVVLSIGRVIG